MRRPRTSTFRPALETAEIRLLATGGVAASVAPHHATGPTHAEAAAVHPAASAHKPVAAHAAVAAEAHHPKPVAHHPAKAAHPARTVSDTGPLGNSTLRVPAPIVADAWVKLVNTTGSTVPYRISLAPYDGGQFLNFTIPSGYPYPTQYQYAGLTASGPGSVANFQIQFAGESPVSLATGPTEALAEGYYIFLGANGLYYVSPILS